MAPNSDESRESITPPQTAERELSEARWRSIVENSPDFICVVDDDDRITYLNQAHGVLQNDAACGTSIYEYCSPAYHETVRKTLAGVRKTGQSDSYDTVAQGPGGTWSWYATRVGPIWGQGRVSAVVLISRDITRRTDAEQALLRAREELERRVDERTAELVEANATLATSEERFRQLAENIEAVFWLGNGDLTELYYVSPSFEQIWELDRPSVHADPRRFLERVHPGDQHMLIELIDADLTSEVIETEFRLVLGSGAIRWIRTRAFPVFDDQGNAIRVAGLSEDVTDRKRAREELLAERHFLRQLLAAHERDQQLTALEIHDGMLQDVVGALMQLELFRDTAAGLTPDDTKKLAGVLRLLQSSIAEGRRLIGGLRPLVVDEQGIVAGIAHLAAEHRARRPIQIEFVHHVRFARLEPFVEATVVRLVQEALNNVVRHSQAKQVLVELTEEPANAPQAGKLLLRVRDDGVGFDAAAPRQGLGLEGMRKRVQLLGGQMDVRSKVGEGTEIRASLPLGEGVVQADVPGK